MYSCCLVQPELGLPSPVYASVAIGPFDKVTYTEHLFQVGEHRNLDSYQEEMAQCRSSEDLF